MHTTLLRLGAVAALVLLFVFAVRGASADGFDPQRCRYDGIPLWGQVEFVDSFADVKIAIVDHYADLRVDIVDWYADDCGEWEVVDYWPDFTVQVVEHFPDITVEFVDGWPGTGYGEWDDCSDPWDDCDDDEWYDGGTEIRCGE